MGWMFRYDDTTKQRLLAHLNGPAYGEHYQVVAQSLRGNHHWQVVDLLPSHPEYNNLSRRFIALNLLAYDRSLRCWGYKDLCESMGPCEVDCPLKFLDMTPLPQGDYAAPWRERVRAYHAKLRARPQLKVGMQVRLNDDVFELREDRGRRGWYIKSTTTNTLYRASNRTVRASQLLAHA